MDAFRTIDNKSELVFLPISEADENYLLDILNVVETSPENTTAVEQQFEATCPEEQNILTLLGLTSDRELQSSCFLFYRDSLVVSFHTHNISNKTNINKALLYSYQHKTCFETFVVAKTKESKGITIDEDMKKQLNEIKAHNCISILDPKKFYGLFQGSVEQVSRRTMMDNTPFKVVRFTPINTGRNEDRLSSDLILKNSFQLKLYKFFDVKKDFLPKLTFTPSNVVVKDGCCYAKLTMTRDQHLNFEEKQIGLFLMKGVAFRVDLDVRYVYVNFQQILSFIKHVEG